MGPRGSSSSMESDSSDNSVSHLLRVDKDLHLIDDGFQVCKGREIQSTRSTIVCLAWLSLVIGIASLVMTGTVVIWVLFGRVDGWSVQPSLSPSEEVCLPCVQLTSDPVTDTGSPLLDVLEVRIDNENESKTCCAHTNAQFAALFKLILQRQQQVQRIANILGRTDNQPNIKLNSSYAVAAHLVFKPGSRTNQAQQLKGPDASVMSYVRPGLTFYDNTVYVINPGMYYVYCQILYDNIDHDTRVASSYVFRDSLVDSNASGIVLKTRHTRNDKDNDRHSSYVGGLLQLHKGDKLYVKVSEPSFVSNDEKGSFFGMFRVGN